LIEQWFRSGAADGFNVMPPAFPEGFEVFLDEVLPILRKRGLFRHEYAGSTLREHYGLNRPVSRFALAPASEDLPLRNQALALSAGPT
jgi:hypothetical protein